MNIETVLGATLSKMLEASSGRRSFLQRIRLAWHQATENP